MDRSNTLSRRPSVRPIAGPRRDWRRLASALLSCLLLLLVASAPASVRALEAPAHDAELRLDPGRIAQSALSDASAIADMDDAAEDAVPSRLSRLVSREGRQLFAHRGIDGIPASAGPRPDRPPRPSRVA